MSESLNSSLRVTQFSQKPSKFRGTEKAFAKSRGHEPDITSEVQGKICAKICTDRQILPLEKGKYVLFSSTKRPKYVLNMRKYAEICAAHIPAANSEEIASG